MSGVGFSEFLILCLIGLIVLGPKRLPKVANQIGSWVGQARRMTRVMRRQLQEELNFDEDFNIKPTSGQPTSAPLPRDDDGYSPLHEKQDELSDADTDGDNGAGDTDADDPAVENDDSERKEDD